MRNYFACPLLLAGMLFSAQASAENLLQLLGEKLVGIYGQTAREKPQSDSFRGDENIPVGFVFDVMQYNKLHASRSKNMAKFALRQVEFNACSIYASNAVSMLTLSQPYTPLSRPERYNKTVHSPTSLEGGSLTGAFLSWSVSLPFGSAASLEKQRVVGTYQEIVALDPHEAISIEAGDLQNPDRFAEHMNRIAMRLDDGRAVIVGLDGKWLTRQYRYEPPGDEVGPHVVLFTGVQRDFDGAPKGFFVMDSAYGMTYYLDRGTLAQSLSSVSKIAKPFYLVSYSRFSQSFSEEISRIRHIDISHAWADEKDGMKLCFRQDAVSLDSSIVQTARRDSAREKQTSFLRLPLNRDGVYVESRGGTIASRSVPDCRNLTVRQYATSPRFEDENKLSIAGMIEFQYDYRQCVFRNEIIDTVPTVFVTPKRDQSGLRQNAGSLQRCARDPVSVSSGFCVFRRIWTAIPSQTGHAFRSKLDSRSVATRGFRVLLC